jgi:hypothetical protein
MTARTAFGKLVGYTVFHCDQKDATIVDMVSENIAELLQGLVLTAAAQLRLEGTKTLYFPVLEDNVWIPAMRRIGFIVRRGSPVIIYTGHGDAHSVPGKALLLAGDRES